MDLQPRRPAHRLQAPGRTLGPTRTVEFEEDRADPYILSMGSAKRDYRLLLLALAELGHRAVIVAAPHAVAGLAVPPGVEIRSGLSEAQCFELVQRSRPCVVPVANRETASGQVTLLNAMMSGRPVVVTECIGSVDYVIDGVDALLVRPGDLKHLEQAIETCWQDGPLRSRIGAAARALAIAHFSDEAVGQIMGRVLRELDELRLTDGSTLGWRLRHCLRRREKVGEPLPHELRLQCGVEPSFTGADQRTPRQGVGLGRELAQIVLGTADRARGYAAGNGSRFDISHDDGTRGDDRVRPDRNATQDDGAMADEDVVVNDDLADGFDALTVRVVQHADRAVVADESAVGQHDVAADAHVRRIGESHSRVDADVVADAMHVTALAQEIAVLNARKACPTKVERPDEPVPDGQLTERLAKHHPGTRALRAAASMSTCSNWRALRSQVLSRTVSKARSDMRAQSAEGSVRMRSTACSSASASSTATQ